MKVICCLHAVLLSARKTKLTPMAYSRCKSDAHQRAHPDVVIFRGFSRSNGNNSTNAFVATDMRKFHVQYWLTIWARCCSTCGVEV